MSLVRSILVLTKARVLLLMMSTAYVGMCLAPISTAHTYLHQVMIILGIFFLASSGAVSNHIFDMEIDRKMRRTSHRPLATGSVPLSYAIILGLGLWMMGTVILLRYANILTWVLTCLGAIGYGLIYTLILKKASPQNIVWGGLSGALPPLLGWVSVSNQIDPQSLLLVALIFIWTPPHFWALALHRKEEYRNAQVPMLPVTHGEWFTIFSMMIYTILLIPVCTLIWLSGLCSLFFLLISITATLIYIAINAMLFFQPKIYAPKSFQYSIFYLYFLFFCMIIDPMVIRYFQ